MSTDATLVDVQRGSSPVVLGFPHTGTDVPPAIWDRLNENGRLLADTDWHIHTLYAGLLHEATTVRATFHRYVIDANRDPAGSSLYPGQNTTGLVPKTDFNGVPIWAADATPTEADHTERVAAFHAPYHAALAAEVARVKAIHGVAVLYDCHSIRSRIPFLFDGLLPDFNVGTDEGRSCDPAIAAATLAVVERATGYSHVLNGRFKGGWTTRHYGRPTTDVHAIQMELAQSTHLASESQPFAYDLDAAERLRPHLKAVLEAIESAALRTRTQDPP